MQASTRQSGSHALKYKQIVAYMENLYISPFFIFKPKYTHTIEKLEIDKIHIFYCRTVSIIRDIIIA